MTTWLPRALVAHLDRLLLNRDISEEVYEAALLDISQWEEIAMVKAGGRDGD